MIGRLTPQERIRLAQRLLKRANSEEGLSARKRADLRRQASNLVKVNAIEATLNAPKALPVVVVNNSALNRAAWRQFRGTKQQPDPKYLALLQLAAWGLANGAEGDWPDKNRFDLQEQVNLLFGWEAENVMTWLFSNQNGVEDPKEQEANLLRLLETTDNPWRAAAHVLNAIYSRQVAQCIALQPASDRS